MTIGERIKAMRIRFGLSQVDFADKINVSKQTLYKYENNIITNIPSDKIEAVAKLCNISPSYLMGWEEPDATQPDDCHLSNIEKKIITEYRKADAITQAMVLRALSIDEPATPKTKKGLLA